MTFSNFPFLRIVVPFVLGITLTATFPSWFSPSIMLPVFILLMLVSGLFIFYPDFHKRTLIAVLLFINTFLAGSFVTYTHDISRQHNFIGNLLENNKAYTVILKISEEVQEKPYYVRTVADVEHVFLDSQWIPVSGKILLWIQKTDSIRIPQYGDVLLAYATIREIKKAMVPTDFNYKQYLVNKHIYHQCYLASNTYSIIDFRPQPIKLFFITLKQQIIAHILKTMNYDETAWVLVAILLGIKTEVSPEIIRSFQASGVMHIMAVSGLHVGIIYLFITMLFRLFDKSRRKKHVEAFISIIIIWLYAMLTGLTPSILRAAIMLSLVLFGQLLKRSIHPFNSLYAAMFIILLFDPFSLFDIGFILSFSALCGIFMFYPIFDKLFYSKYKLLNQIWSLIAVSLSAQLGTIPAVLYFFGQFPVYFLLANLLITPLVSIVLFVSIISLFLNLIPGLSAFFSWFLPKLYWFFVSIPQMIASLPMSSLQPVFITLSTALFLGATIVMLYFFITTKKTVLGYATIIFLLISTLVQQHAQEKERKSVFVIHLTKKDQTLFAIKDKLVLLVYLSKPNTFSKELYSFKRYAQQYGLLFHVLNPREELPFALNEFPFLAYRKYTFCVTSSNKEKKICRAFPHNIYILK